ncbi:MAG: DUF192 domain-containing protein [Candidatus Brennerbacteria bacterium]|nr:DUF192 domain-containing protein [Candidatus Brennerbacteria bacterium]
MSALIKFFMVLFGMALGIALVGAPYFSSLFSLENKGEVKINEQIIVVDIVRDADTRAKGLAGRAGLGVNEGMLFLFDEAARYPFWMKGVSFPIDIVWISGNEIVGVEERVPPEPGVSEHDLKNYVPPAPVDKVLELAAGRARLLRAKAGDVVKVRRLIAGGARLLSFDEISETVHEWGAQYRGGR